MNDLLGLVQTLQMALKALGMYTAAHPRARASLEALTATVEEWLEASPVLHLAASGGKLFVDGVPFEGHSVHVTTTSKILMDRQISGIIFSRGVAPEEIQELLELLILKPARIEEAGGAVTYLESRKLAHVKLAQVQYREVREGEGGTEDGSGPALKTVAAPEAPPPPAAPEPAPVEAPPAPRLDPVQVQADQWRHEFRELARHQPEGADPAAGADLSYLGGSLACVGLGDGFPSAQQMEGLRQALLELPGETLLSVVAGLDSLPRAPEGLRMGFQALAPEAFAQATAELMEAGGDWSALKERLDGILRGAPSFQGMLAALEGQLRMRGMGLDQLQELVSRLDWDTLGVDEQLRLVQDREHFWKLSHTQRLGFLRRLLEEGRTDAFAAILELIVKHLTGDDAARREMAARTLSGVAQWLAVPGLPQDSEGAFLQGLAAHFGWETFPQIHRATTEALGVALGAMVARGEPGQALTVLQELEGLCAFLDNQESWRQEALAWLRERLAQPSALARVLELVHTSTPESLLTELIPYLEAVGPPAAHKLVETLGDEQDRKRRARIMEVIRGLGAPALPAIYEGLDSDRWYLVRNTLNLLADMGEVEALEAAQACLGHTDGRVRRAAVRTVWKLGGAQAVPALLKAFTAADPETLQEIMFAFGQIRSAAAVPMLGRFATERRVPEKLRIRAVETLGLIGDGAAQPYLEEIVRRKGRFITTAEATELRVAGCRGLLALGTPEAASALRELVDQEPRNNDKPLLQQVAAQLRP